MRFILTFILFFVSHACVTSAEFQYAEYAETTYTRNSTKVAMPGFIITLSGGPFDGKSHIGESDRPLISSELAYKTFYSSMKFEPQEGSRIKTLNLLGAQGWEVVHISENSDPVFGDKFSATTKVYLLKKTSAK